MGDNVNHPNHYQNIAGVEAIDILNDVVKDLPGKQAAILWNTLKYLLRFQKKNGVEDLKKAQNYLQYLIDDIEAVQEVDKNIQENTNPEKCLCAIYKSKISGYAEICYSTEMLYGTCEKIRFTNELSGDMFIAEFFNKFNSEDYKEETYSIRDVLINSNYIVPNTTDNFCIKFPWRGIVERFRIYKEDEKYILEFIYKNEVKRIDPKQMINANKEDK